MDTASTSDAVTFITYVQSLKRKIKQFEKQVEVSSRHSYGSLHLPWLALSPSRGVSWSTEASHHRWKCLGKCRCWCPEPLCFKMRCQGVPCTPRLESHCFCFLRFCISIDLQVFQPNFLSVIWSQGGAWPQRGSSSLGPALGAASDHSARDQGFLEKRDILMSCVLQPQSLLFYETLDAISIIVIREKPSFCFLTPQALPQWPALAGEAEVPVPAFLALHRQHRGRVGGLQ